MKGLIQQILDNSNTFSQFKSELQLNGIQVTDEDRLRETFDKKKDPFAY